MEPKVHREILGVHMESPGIHETSGYSVVSLGIDSGASEMHR